MNFLSNQPPLRSTPYPAHSLLLALWVVGLLAALLAFFFYSLEPRDLPYRARTVEFEVSAGEGFQEIIDRLYAAQLTRTSWAVKVYAVLSGSATKLRAGRYLLSSGLTSEAIVRRLADGAMEEIEVRIPEGATRYEADETLARAGVILERGDLVAYDDQESPGSFSIFEGRLFPDSYRFFRESHPADVVKKLLAAFDRKAHPLISGDNPSDSEYSKRLIMASILEKEVPHADDRRIVAGILLKRLRAGMPLQVDATVCYAKQVAARAPVPCLPITSADLALPSPYNTYVHRGLPPGPIGSPGTDALIAAMNPQSSPYWFYLSDPKTHRTIFSATLEEHAKNISRYLR
jgi:UPF0755 protein